MVCRSGWMLSCFIIFLFFFHMPCVHHDQIFISIPKDPSPNQHCLPPSKQDEQLHFMPFFLNTFVTSDSVINQLNLSSPHRQGDFEFISQERRHEECHLNSRLFNRKFQPIMAMKVRRESILIVFTGHVPEHRKIRWSSCAKY